MAPFQSLDAECFDQQANIKAIKPTKRKLVLVYAFSFSVWLHATEIIQ